MSQAMRWYQLSDAGKPCVVLPSNQNTQHLNNFFNPEHLNNVGSKSGVLNSNQTNLSINRKNSDKNNTATASSVPTSLRGLQYADGFFTTMAVDKSQLKWQSYHKERVYSHLQALYLYLSDEVENQLWQTVSSLAKNIEAGIIKLVVTRQAQTLSGYAFATQLNHNQCDIWIGVLKTPPLATKVASFLNKCLQKKSQSPVFLQPPITATCLESQLASLPEPIAGLKSLNRLDNVLIAGELQRYNQVNSNISEGLVRDLAGNWVEGVMSNLFYQLDNDYINKQTCSLYSASIDNGYSKYNRSDDKRTAQWYTPPINSSGVRGVMRQVIIDKLITLNQPVQIRPLTDKDLTTISALFFCNAVRGVIPVQTLHLPKNLLDKRVDLSLKVYD